MKQTWLADVGLWPAKGDIWGPMRACSTRRAPEPFKSLKEAWQEHDCKDAGMLSALFSFRATVTMVSKSIEGPDMRGRKAVTRSATTSRGRRPKGLVQVCGAL